MGCPELTKAGKPCPSRPRKGGPDPDGVERCHGHSVHPDAIAIRERQASAGRVLGKKATPKRRAKSPKKSQPVAVPSALIEAPPAEPPRSPGAVSFGTREGILRFLEDAGAKGITDELGAEQLKALASLGRAAIEWHKADPKGGKGGGRGDKIIMPTVVGSMADVERLKAANAEAQAEPEAVLH